MPNINDNPETSASQTRRILAYMKAGNKITGMQALDMFGVWSFTRRICDVEKIIGYPPKRNRIKVKNREGKDVWIKEYYL